MHVKIHRSDTPLFSCRYPERGEGVYAKASIYVFEKNYFRKFLEKFYPTGYFKMYNITFVGVCCVFVFFSWLIPTRPAKLSVILTPSKPVSVWPGGCSESQLYWENVLWEAADFSYFGPKMSKNPGLWTFSRNGWTHFPFFRLAKQPGDMVVLYVGKIAVSANTVTNETGIVGRDYEACPYQGLG